MGEAKAAFIAAFQHHAIALADLERHNSIHEGLERMLQECCASDTTTDTLRRKYAEVRLGEYKSRLLNAHSELELARERFERKRGLVEQGISSQDEFQLARRDHDQAQADFSAVHEAIDIEMEAEHVAHDRALRIAAVNLDAARRRLHVLGLDGEEIDALAAGSGGPLSRYALRSPMAGRVVMRQAVIGENVSSADALFAVADTTRMWLMLNLQERDLASVSPSDRVLFTIDGLPGRGFEGVIDWISSEVEEPTRTIRARVPLDNADGLLRAHMFGRARVIVHDEDEVLTVPESAIQSDGCCTIVFVRDSDTVYRPRKVVLGTQVRGLAEVRSGLAAGEHVVTTGSFLLKTEVLKSNIGAGCCEVDPGR
jgi:cobalt-zinc-cadmium efflux system membrane fusion protein